MYKVKVRNLTGAALSVPPGVVPPYGSREFIIQREEVLNVLLQAQQRLKSFKLDVTEMTNASPEQNKPDLDYSSMTRKELAKLYKERFGKGAGNLSKAKLISKLEEADKSD